MGRRFMFMKKKLTPVPDHNIQTISLKPLGQSKPNFILLCGASLGKGNETVYKRSRSHD